MFLEMHQKCLIGTEDWNVDGDQIKQLFFEVPLKYLIQTED